MINALQFDRSFRVWCHFVLHFPQVDVFPERLHLSADDGVRGGTSDYLGLYATRQMDLYQYYRPASGIVCQLYNRLRSHSGQQGG